MSLRNKVQKLERAMGPPDEKHPCPFLTRDEMAVYAALTVERILALKRNKKKPRTHKFDLPVAPEDKQKRNEVFATTVEKAKAIEAAGRLPEILDILRSKGLGQVCDG